MPKTPIYIKSLELKNIRTFGDVTLDFQKSDGILPQWTLILGDNGIGKSTLLQCIAWMKPNVPDFGDKSGDKINPKNIEANINNEENDTLVRLVRKTGNANENSTINAKFVAKRNFIRKSLSTESFCEQSITIKVEDGKLKDFPTNFSTNSKEIFLKSDVVLYAYSASRRAGKLNINNVGLADTIPSFISDDTILYDPEEILHRIHYAQLGATKSEKFKYKRYLDKIKEVLVSVLPDFEAVNDITISSPKLIKSRIQEIEIMISTRHGKMIPFNDFSLGYKTVTSWVIDLSWRLINEYPTSNNPLSEPAIVIVDEIDLHLHPIWQREIISSLSNHFPKVQFIATAHSPLMVQSVTNANCAVLRIAEDKVEIIKNPVDVDGWRVDQILTSSLFDLPSSRGAEYERLLKEREQIVSKKKLTAIDEKKLKEINKQLYMFPAEETVEEIEERKVISNLIDKIKKKKILIEV